MYSKTARRVRTLVTAVTPICVLAGCGPLSNDDVRERYASPAAQSELVYAESADETAASDFEDRIANGSFENKDETGRPRGWAVSPAEIILKDGSMVVHPYDGNEYVMLRSVGDRNGILACPLRLKPEDLGKTVVATAEGRAPLWRYMFLSVRYAVDGKYTENLHEWPACPYNWTENIARETIPSNADPESVEVRILIRDVAGYTFCVDHVRAFVLGDG